MKQLENNNCFDWAKEFPKLCDKDGNFEGFDIVVGNPPYIPLSKLPELETEKDNYLTYKQTGDVYMLFIERGVQILKKGGILSYIISNKWMRASYGKSLRSYLLQNTKIDKIIDFDSLKVFDKATVDTNIISVCKQKDANNKVEAVRFDKTFNLKKDSISQYFEKNKILLSNLNSDSWNLTSEKEDSIKNKINKIGKPLKNWNINIYRGITTGLNEAFIINTETKNKLIKLDKRNKKIIKPILRGRDIKKYYYKWSDLWIIAIFSPQKIDIEKYKYIKIHLETYKKKLLSKPKKHTEEWFGRKTGNFKWFENQDNTAYFPFFEKEKIIFTKASQTKSFSYDNKGYYLQNTSYLLTGENIKYLLALLNSKLINYAFLRFFQSGGIEGEITVQAVKEFPIPEITEQNIKTVNKIKKLVNKILNAKEKNINSDILKEQKKIDKLVYKLYKLTDDEIIMIEK